LSARNTAESNGAIENTMDVASCAGCSRHRQRIVKSRDSDPTKK
jgi:hypothetical protein